MFIFTTNKKIDPPRTNYLSRGQYEEGFEAGMIQSDGNFFIIETILSMFITIHLIVK